jgi:hypothetical protein
MPTKPSTLPIAEVVNHSAIWTARRCPQRWRYQYHDRLEPRVTKLMLKRGTWVHAALQAEHLRIGIEKGSLLLVPEEIEVSDVGMVRVLADDSKLMVGDEDSYTFYDLSWQGMLALLTDLVWERVFTAEHELYTEHGHTLPEVCEKIVRGYFWQYRKVLEKETPLLVEYQWQREHNGVLWGGQLDLLLRDAKNRVVVRDWKTTKAAPEDNPLTALLESQLHLYPWGIAEVLSEHKLKVNAVEWDYLVSKPPAKPKLNQDGTLSRVSVDTDALTFFEAIKEYGLDLDTPCYKPDKKKDPDPLEGLTPRMVLKELMQGTDRYKRVLKPRSTKATERIIYEAERTAGFIRMLTHAPEAAWRTSNRTCKWECPYNDLCVGDLYGQDTSLLRERDFRLREKEPYIPLGTNDDEES